MSSLHASLYKPINFLGDYTEKPEYVSTLKKQSTVASKSPAKISYVQTTQKNSLIQKYSNEGQNFLKGNQIQNFLKDLIADLKLNQNQLQTSQTPYANLIEIPQEAKIYPEDLEKIAQKYFSFEIPKQQYQKSQVSSEIVPKEHKVRSALTKQSNYSTHQNSYSQQSYQQYTSNDNYGASTYRRVQSPQSPSKYQQNVNYSSNYSSQLSQSNYIPYQQSYQPKQYVPAQESSIPRSMSNSYVRQQTLPISYQQQQQSPGNQKLQKLDSNIYGEKYRVNQKKPDNNKNVISNKNIFSPILAQGMSKQKQLQRQAQFKTKDPSQVGYKPGVKVQQAIAQAKASGRKYTDPEFPPNISSISKNGSWYDGEPLPGRDWIRPENYFKQGYELFEQGIIPGDIKQAGLGDCYFQCTLAALAEWPERIQRIFSSPEKSQWGVYSVWVVWSGVWQEVVVDDNLWYDSEYGQFVSMQSNGNEIWPQIIEKAWAKLHGDFLKIDGGFARDPLHDFTGAPVMHFRIKENQNWNQLRDILFGQLLQGEKNDFIMCAGTYGENEDEEELGDDQERDGIFYGHAYSILAAYEIYVDGKYTKLIKFRNPHGEGEFTGRFSDSDPVWNRVSQQDKQRLEYTEKDDGIFFLEYDKLRTYFEDVQICSYRNNYIYEGIKVNAQLGEQENYFKVTIPQGSNNGYYYFQLNQVAKAQFDDDDYTYQNGTINVMDQTGKWVISVSGKQKNISSYKYQQNPKVLQPGTYYVMTKLKIGQVQSRLGIRSYGFGVYGQKKVQIDGPLSPSQISQYASQLKQTPYGVSETIQSFVI